MTSAAASGASGFLCGDDAAEFMRQRGEQTWEAANEAGGRAVEWEDDCARCGDGSGLRVLCGYCHLVFHPTCLDPPTGVENWDDEVFACGRCVTDAMGKAVSTTPRARLMRELRQRRATTAAAEARRAARDDDIRDEHKALALFGDDATEFRDSKGEHEDAVPALPVPHSRVRRAPLALCGSAGEQHKRHAPRGGGSSGGSDYAFHLSELAELNAIEYAAKYATKTKPGDYVIDCAPPAAGGAAAAAAAAASEGGRCFTKDKECPLSAYAAAAAAVIAPLGAPGNERVECDGGLHVRWDYSAKYVTKPVVGACNNAGLAACEDGDDMPALVSASDSDSG